jgi:fumarate hydratase subunit beta
MTSKYNVCDFIDNTVKLRARERILLSGTIYTARDAAHSRIISLLENNEKLPFDLKNSAIYYCGPSPSKPGQIIGACGPTTSKRMDIFTPKLLSCGVKILIGKGARSEYVVKAIKEFNAIYFTAVGGTAALLSKSIIKADIIAFEDLGTEAVYRFEIKDMPLMAAITGDENAFNF